jgi:FkbM family methyltransferase
MLIPFDKMPVGDIKGVIHIGAHEAEELSGYCNVGISKVLWVEANPLKWDLLIEKISPFPYMVLGKFAAAASSNKLAKFNIANNGQSSSLLEFGSHSSSYPDIKYIDEVTVNLLTVDDWLDQLGANKVIYNFVNIDIQGYELEALRGMVKQLEFVDYIYTEINTSDVYKNCANAADLDKFLSGFGFSRVATKETDQGWGDALYSRKNKTFLKAKFKYVNFVDGLWGRYHRFRSRFLNAVAARPGAEITWT